MFDSMYIAWKYLSFHPSRTLILVSCVTLIAVLPLSLDRLLAESERQLLSRAETTPLIVGAKGSSLDLAMNSLYFSDEVPELVSMADAESLAGSGLAAPVPLYVRFHARGFPIVGTTLDYLDFRGLRVAEGRTLAMLGECVLGATVASELGLGPGDHLLSSPETLFDLAGIYPLKMKVVGVLAPTRSPDDRAVFVDVKTAWVIQGLVHGHQDLSAVRDPSLVMDRGDGTVIATAKLVSYTEITEGNIDSFHFHGDPSNYPLTSLLALPNDEKSATLLRGRYIGDARTQIVRPRDVIDGLLANIFRIKRVLDAVILLVSGATLLALILVFALSLRLRQREIQTIFRLGCGRATIARLLGSEILIILLAAAMLCAVALVLLQRYEELLVRHWFL